MWNQRVNEALDNYNDLRILVMIRNMATRQYRIFEEEAVRYVPTEYTWQFNKNGNLEGKRKDNSSHVFSWQPHGSQFTIIKDVPASARRFSIDPNVPQVPPESILAYVRFKPEWITIYGQD